MSIEQNKDIYGLSVAFRLRSDRFQVARGLRDHFATTVAYLWASCALSVAISVPFLPFRFPNTSALPCRRDKNSAGRNAHAC